MSAKLQTLFYIYMYISLSPAVNQEWPTNRLCSSLFFLFLAAKLKAVRDPLPPHGETH